MNVSAHKLSYSNTNHFSDLIVKYQNNDSALSKYITGFASYENFKKQIIEKQKAIINRNVLVDELLHQYKNINDKDVTVNQIQKLKLNNTFTITTGHQCCLFTGPLYFIFKIISTINLANELNAELPENNFVPIFWMATEDHDFAEVNHINLMNKKIVFASNQAGNAVGKIMLHDIDNIIAEIEELIKNFEHGNTAIALLKNAYNANQNIAEATRIFVHELFKKDGLVILDADSKALKNEFRNTIANDIDKNNNLDLVVNCTNQLINDGFIDKAQITPRAVNFFMLDDNKRLRIDKTENNFNLKDSDISFSNHDILKLVSTNPEKFSPNVVMRPLYQETILPNLAYIGGGAEVTYWLQLKMVFESNNVLFPILLLRNSAQILEKNAFEKIANMGFDISNTFEDSSALQKKYLKKHTTQINFENEVNELQITFNHIKNKAIAIDKTLENTVDAEFYKANASLKNIEQKILKAQKRNEETSLQQIDKFKQKYFPDNMLQERNDNFLYFFAKYGFDFLNVLKAELKPMQQSFSVLLID